MPSSGQTAYSDVIRLLRLCSIPMRSKAHSGRWTGLSEVQVGRNVQAPYASLVKALGPKNNQDAWHWYTAECHGLFCFLTMDFKLQRSIAAQAGHPAIKAMTTPVMTPAEFARKFGIRQVAPHLLSHEEADFFVHPTLSLPEGRRRPKSRSKLAADPPDVARRNGRQ